MKWFAPSVAGSLMALLIPTASLSAQAAPAQTEVSARTSSITTQGATSVAPVQIPPFSNGNGITVTAVELLETPRSFRVLLSDPVVASTPGVKAPPGNSLSVVVTLPESYDANPSRRYPSLYLLHGRGGNAKDWILAGNVEPTTRGRDVITIMPEGGRGSWYTNWVNQSGGAAQWETFHIQHLIPWIDSNLRTIADGKHRAIAGLSMGGYGALHYAFKYPSTFAHVSSYSGGVDLEDQVIRAAVLGTPAAENFALTPVDGTGPFGNPIWPADTVWKSENPVRHAEALRGKSISLFAGSGQTDTDIIERGAGNSTNTLHRRLNSLGIANTFDMYGRNTSWGGYSCDGGHNFQCWSMALAKDFNTIMNAID